MSLIFQDDTAGTEVDGNPDFYVGITSSSSSTNQLTSHDHSDMLAGNNMFSPSDRYINEHTTSAVFHNGSIAQRNIFDSNRSARKPKIPAAKMLLFAVPLVSLLTVVTSLLIFEMVDVKEVKDEPQTVPIINLTALCDNSKPGKLVKRFVHGGHLANWHRWRWMGQILASYYPGPQFKRNFICGGVLIHPRWLLTAAHCLKDPDFPSQKRIVNTLQVRLWPANVSENTNVSSAVTVTPLKTFVNRKYKFDAIRGIPLLHDIGLVYLPSSKHVFSTACLPAFDTHTHDFNLTDCKSAGWGVDVPDGNTSPFLKVAERSLVEEDECQAKIKDVDIRNGHLCSWNNDSAMCKGDSGSGLKCLNMDNGGWELHGLVSFGDGFCKGAQPDVFTRVSDYLPWIQEVVDHNTHITES